MSQWELHPPERVVGTVHGVPAARPVPQDAARHHYGKGRGRGRLLRYSSLKDDDEWCSTLLTP